MLQQYQEHQFLKPTRFSFFSLLLPKSKDEAKQMLSFSFFSLLHDFNNVYFWSFDCFSFFSLLLEEVLKLIKELSVLVSFRCYSHPENGKTYYVTCFSFFSLLQEDAKASQLLMKSFSFFSLLQNIQDFGDHADVVLVSFRCYNSEYMEESFFP